MPPTPPMAAPKGPPVPPAEEASVSIPAPVSALGGAAVGDVVTFTVESIDGETASLSRSKEDEAMETPAAKPSMISQAAKLYEGE